MVRPDDGFIASKGQWTMIMWANTRNFYWRFEKNASRVTFTVEESLIG